MRFCEILLEYDRSKTIDAYWSKLWPIVLKDNYARWQLAEFEGNHPTHNVEYPEPEEYQAYVMPWFENADPTPNKSLVRWIVAMYVNKKINSVEDLNRVREVLRKIERLKTAGYFRRHPEHRGLTDLSKTPSLFALETAVDQINPAEYESEADRARKKAALMAGEDQAEILLNNSRYKVVIPKTAMAASFYGINTKWCTTAENGGMFDFYTKNGPLIIILDKKSNNRWQFHFASNQFMDEQDERIAIILFAIRHPTVMHAIFDYIPSGVALRMNIGLPVKQVGNLDMSYVLDEINLPDGLRVDGDLALTGCTGLHSLPRNFYVYGYADFSGCTNLTEIPDDLKFDDSVNFVRCSNLSKLGRNMKVGGDLYINHTAISALPDDIEVFGDVYIKGCPAELDRQPKPTGIKGDIYRP